eukprot:TRINITY_DN92641_c0_g1_i1.p1 TRINITY_DN92641_c0_g1~~TRINITY_DN92641_c0_g1_i1.p1  ORF type:complete len:238 (+),score=55.14 TRINITY_DN92641_c0_g1_i1:136-849(+)
MTRHWDRSRSPCRSSVPYGDAGGGTSSDATADSDGGLRRPTAGAAKTLLCTPPPKAPRRRRAASPIEWTTPHRLSLEFVAEKVESPAGFNANEVNEEGQSLLILAASEPDSAATVKRLLASAADPNECDGRGASPLEWACAFGGDLGTIQALIEAKADLEKQDDDGLTPLMAASQNGRADVVRLLLSAGAEADGGGKGFGSRAGSALQLAQEAKHENVVQLLLEAAAQESASGRHPT